MIFQTYDPYNNDDLNIKDINGNLNNDISRDCFICFDSIDIYGKTPMQLCRHTGYISECSCNVAVHNTCLCTWIGMTSKCPICRQPIIIIENNKMYKILAYVNPHVLKFLVLNKNLLINTLNIYITLLFAFTELIYLWKISSHIEDIWG